MHVGRPSTAIVPSLDGEVLIALSRTTAALTGREVATLARRGSQSAIAVALDRLVGQGLVLREEVGRAYLHTLNRDHVAAPIVDLLAGLRGELLRRLRDEIGSWAIQPIHASFFGSAARGDGDLDSDIDLLVVQPEDVDPEDEDWWQQIDRLAEAVLAWTGNSAGIVQISPSGFAALRTDPPEIVADLQRDGIDLAGVPLSTHFAGASSPDEPSSPRSNTAVRRPRRTHAPT
jgi:predicted nucleotidyltransferase